MELNLDTELKLIFNDIFTFKRKSAVFARKQHFFGRSVIIGLGKIQSYQWFASRQQEVLSPIMRKLHRNNIGNRLSITLFI